MAPRAGLGPLQPSEARLGETTGFSPGSPNSRSEFGSSGWTRTSNPPVNSHVYQIHRRLLEAARAVFIGLFESLGQPLTTRFHARMSPICPRAGIRVLTGGTASIELMSPAVA